MRCKRCPQVAVVDECCVSHAMATAVERNDRDRAYAIARQYGRLDSEVRRLIRNRSEMISMALVSRALEEQRA